MASHPDDLTIVFNVNQQSADSRLTAVQIASLLRLLGLRPQEAV